MIDSEIALIRALQEQAAWLEAPMQFFSFLGQPEFYLLVVPLLYWCRDPRLGLRLGLLMGISSGINEALKVAFHLPRPYWVSPEVRALESYPSFGLPSAHAQGAVTFWGLIAATVRRRWFSAFAVALIFLIGASRVFLGVHYPADVVAGWVFGIAVLIAFFALEEPVGRRVAALPLSRQVLLAFAGSLALALASFAALASLGDWEVPASWAAGALERSGEPIHPLFLRDAVTASGLFFGFAAGAAAEHRRWSMCVLGTGPVRLLRYVFGITVTGVIWFGLGLLVPPDPVPAASLVQFLRAAAAGAWVSFGAPAVFARANPARGGA
ncbi:MULTISPECIES: phosphatase PAP2 family protein [unclassified Methanoculleus]|jgi:membrane-associated phospholipid phosphatase|uniref:Phosphatase PAP2 family protein n=1 Tax=Methanoculleus palmolei TaxID=72612 RepID=A0ABD8A6K9_9EURY|nr:phosphatase PAP2 family protein [Methanoculleus sp. UBA377]MDD2472507.1 phosphatase PAP2 family protein [Methanoculleus sp.]WOX55194.1 phosphatase PAP2 family protein [Methanoculleus palmolei]